MAAAAWRGEAWVPVVAGRLAAAQDPLGVRWLAATGGTDAAAAVGAALAALPHGPERCQLVARYGHPSLFAALLGWMESDDPLQAAAAGAAFTRMTGVEVEGRRVQTQGDDAADEFAREFAPEVFLPDLAKARAVLAGDAARWQAGGRWCRGHDLATSLSSQAQRAVDMQARWKPRVRYPSTLITTADHDDRVVPAHSFKYAATLQEAHAGPNPVLIRIETRAGHGAGKPTAKIIEEAADRWAFLVRELDMKPRLTMSSP
jgi:hypothetical protein